MGWVKIIIMAVIIAICIFFFMQNTEPVAVQFGLSPVNEYKFFETPRIPLFLVILCSVVLGVLMGGVYDLYRRFQLGKSLRQKQKTIDRLEKEIQSLRGPEPEEPPSLNKEG